MNECHFILYLQALLHASVTCHQKLIVEWIAAGDLEDATAKEVTTFFFMFCSAYYLFIYY